MSHLADQPLDWDALAAKARRCAEFFLLPLRDSHWRGQSGDYSGSGVGSSLDFQDHRVYAPGDDPRHINWNAYARTGNYSVKLYREEVQPVVDVLFDVSGSMFHEPGKSGRAVELFYFLCAAAEKSGASLRPWLLKGCRWKQVDRGDVFSHRWRGAADELPSTDASEAPALHHVPFRSRSLRLVVSDLLFASSAPEPLIRQLLRQGGRAALFVPHSASESDPGWEGNFEFIDSEAGSRHDRLIDRHILKRYLDSYHRHFDAWKSAAIRNSIPFARVAAGIPLENALKTEAVGTRALVLP